MTEEELYSLYAKYRHLQTEVKKYFTCCDFYEFQEVYRFLQTVEEAKRGLEDVAQGKISKIDLKEL